MNKVELLVTMAAKPVVQGETPLHITFPATVAHKTKSGEISRISPPFLSEFSNKE